MAGDSTTHSVTVAVPPDRAFAAFTAQLGAWWPPEYTWSGDALEEIAIEPREGGACFERGPHGFRCDWGRVLDWKPGRNLTLAWQISPAREPVPDPARASEVEVRFSESADGIEVTLEHRDFSGHGEGADGYREAMGSEQGWPYILSRYAEHLGGGERS
jgi:uncharacterized protein YndB with AHSA1/START domain